jgi:dephospho-CoA kinase
MIKLGLTGVIGSGKTTIAEKFSERGIPVLNTDLLTRDIMESNETIISSMIKTFGELSYLNNKLNRKYIADIVFNDSKQLDLLNKITYPIVRQEIIKWIDLQTTDFCVVESAIMFNSDLYTLFDELICVTAYKETRIERVIKRDNSTKEQVLARMDKQISQEEMAKKCRFIILNNSEDVLFLSLDDQIRRILKMLEYEILSSNTQN